MPTEAILSTARQFLGVDPTVPITLEPIKRGGSGRTIVRVKTPVHEPFIGIHWTEEREDNAQFVPVARFLKQARLRVPEIIHDRARYRVALVEDFLGLDADGLRNNQDFLDLAERLGTVARHLVHRDFQSQNLMIKDGKVWLIDFQGLRRGRQEYDLASLIYDPYLDHTADEREALLELWEDISDERPVEALFHECAAQRLMQALGAYGNIVKNRGDDWYRPHIATAARLLGEVTAGTPLESPLAPVLAAALESKP